MVYCCHIWRGQRATPVAIFLQVPLRPLSSLVGPRAGSGVPGPLCPWQPPFNLEVAPFVSLLPILFRSARGQAGVVGRGRLRCLACHFRTWRVCLGSSLSWLPPQHLFSVPPS